jgi:hypothetical protein
MGCTRSRARSWGTQDPLSYLTTELLAVRTGVRMVHVPFKVR